MNVITAPNHAPALGFFEDAFHTHIFLAGSIEQGKARRWHEEVMHPFSDEPDVTFFNPRREEWDATWGQQPDNPLLVEQIQWELLHIEKADITFFYFQAGTQSPISLLELGMCLGRGDSVIVVCEPGFWREANVHQTCAFFGQPIYPTIEAGIEQLRLSV